MASFFNKKDYLSIFPGFYPKSIEGSHFNCTNQFSNAQQIESMIKRLKPNLVEVILSFLVILLVTTETYWRNRIWNSEIDLWTDCVKKSPNKERPHLNLGVALFGQGRNQEAIAHYTEALRIKPGYAEAHFSLGLAYLIIGNRSSALEQYKILKTINPDLANTLANTLSRKIFK